MKDMRIGTVGRVLKFVPILACLVGCGDDDDTSRAIATATASPSPVSTATALPSPTSTATERPTSTPEPVDFVANAEDFECLLSWDKVREFRITNRLGRLDEALDLARDPQPGRQFPIGTIIQLFPGEAMVKRGPEVDPDNNNWEYFELETSAAGTSIRVRGRDEVVNRFGGQCFGCHADARDFDFICEVGRGCVELPLSRDVFAALQEADPRCPD